jgi:DNA binding domain, excisionase family
MKTTLTKDEVAKILRVSERTIDNLRKNQGLPYVTVGGLIRFTEEDINTWLRNQSTVDPCDMLKKLEESQVSRN